jgi:glycosyltransferase involved in cell wall biosynthesis
MFLVTEDWYFWAHRLPQARAARDAGFHVSVATRVDRHADLIRAEGFGLHALGWRRGSLNPMGAIAAVFEIAALYRRERPDIVHHVSQKPIILGSVAARSVGVRHVVNAFTGLGFLFVTDSPRTRTVRAILLPVLRAVTGGDGVRFLVENPDDAAILSRRGVGSGDRIQLIRGSGVDLDRYAALPEPDGPITIGCATRMLRIKGVEDLVAAFRLLRDRDPAAQLLLAGAPDPENPAAVPEAMLRAWAAEPGIAWLGHVSDIREVWARAHVAVLASRGGEGIPMSLMEAAACGRPMVATDVAGCREIVRNDETGLLTPPGDIPALAVALERMVRQPALRARCGLAARRYVASGLDAATVGREIVAVYRKLLAMEPARS